MVRIKETVKWFVLNRIAPSLPTSKLRVWALKRCGVEITTPIHIYGGFNVRLGSGRLVILPGVSIGPKVLLDGRGELIVGENVTIAYEAIIWTEHHDYNDIHFGPKRGKVTIEKYAWICSRAIILPGVTIGEGAVVASGAVVTISVAPYTIVGGVPAKPIGVREQKDYLYGYTR